MSEQYWWFLYHASKWFLLSKWTVFAFQNLKGTLCSSSLFLSVKGTVPFSNWTDFVFRNLKGTPCSSNLFLSEMDQFLFCSIFKKGTVHFQAIIRGTDWTYSVILVKRNMSKRDCCCPFPKSNIKSVTAV